jgi:hypothetical protein
VHDAALPGGLGEELGGTLGKPQAGVRDDQPDAAQTVDAGVILPRSAA